MPYNISLESSDIRFFAHVYRGLSSINQQKQIEHAFFIDLGGYLHMIMSNLPLIASSWLIAFTMMAM